MSAASERGTCGAATTSGLLGGARFVRRCGRPAEADGLCAMHGNAERQAIAEWLGKIDPTDEEKP